MSCPVRLILFSLAVTFCIACNDVILTDQCGTAAVISGRTFSFAVELSPRLTAGPPTAALQLLEIADNTSSTYGTTIHIHHGFICISHLPALLADVLPSTDPIMQPNHAICVDGMNKGGLSVAVLYQEETLSLPAYEQQSAKASAINFLDLPAFLLARYASVAEVEHELSNNIQVVWAPHYNVLGGAVSFGDQDVPPLHLAVHDATGASLVVQFKDGAMQVLRNPMGVLANSPFLQQQVQHYEAWLQQHDLPSTGNVSGHVWELPGNFSSPSRFTRMAMLKTAAVGTCWPTEAGGEVQQLSPGTVPDGYPAASPTLLAVMGIIQSVYLPRGIDDDGMADAADLAHTEVTPYSTLRDHTAKVFYYRTGNNVLYRSVALSSFPWARSGGQLTHKPLLAPTQPWAIAEDAWGLFDYTSSRKRALR